MPSDPAPVSPPQTPASLLVAAVVAALEGLVLLGYAVGESVHLSSDRLTMGLTVAAFFAAYGVFLLACARALRRCQSWARSPLVLTQLIQLGVAWGFWGGQTTLVAVALAVVAVVGLVGLLHPDSMDALSVD